MDYTSLSLCMNDYCVEILSKLFTSTDNCRVLSIGAWSQNKIIMNDVHIF